MVIIVRGYAAEGLIVTDKSRENGWERKYFLCNMPLLIICSVVGVFHVQGS